MSAIETMVPKRQSLLRSTSLVSLLTLISRMVGFVRDMLIAQFFGAQAGMDAFYVAFRIPNFMRRLFAEGAFSQAFVPVLAEYQQTRTVDDVRLFIARIAGQLGVALSIVTVIGMLAAPIIIFIFAPGFGEHSTRSVLATEMLRLTFPFLMLVSMTAMAGAVLNTYGYFGIPAFTPVILNICMILAAIYLSPHLDQPVVGLAWGVLIAGIAQFLFQIPFLYHRRLLVKPKMGWSDPGVRRVLKLMVPALFGVSIAQLNLMVDSIFASFLKVGSVTWLYYTDRLTDFPLGVFGVAIATVILPHLSRRHAEQSTENYSRALDWGLRTLLMIGIPSGLGLAMFSMPLIASCFTYGAFTVNDLIQTQKSLIALGSGVPAFMMVKVLASGFYAKQDIKTPVKVGAIAMVVNSILCAFLIWPLAHAGLALASALAGYINCGILLVLLIRRGIYQPLNGWLKFTLQLLFANLVIAVYLYMMIGSMDYWLAYSAVMRLLLVIAHVSAAVLIYLISLRLAGVRFAQFRGQMKE
ncbi:putative peptidoglycan biosynthesis protein MurJ [Legionella massiliensis]|uniref:Probable lipid II flippase MurJ n=1 Tax=Legionella massiliensis TaxID=1034943 RepID=A0A078KVG3_9GAMM|nr:murein biosynthesis integral membrane protein MurJ [Legionella massiliensis]CDZ76971.1 putative peptidoglycan biosynthesis protein MurJ [Legionella massiliensis]CEE12709.1 putative peptidoglycan biosynthesis protein MurJ [Legionella massiliensis]